MVSAVCVVFYEKIMVSGACVGLRVSAACVVIVIKNQIIPIVDNFYFSHNFIRVDLYNFVWNYTMVWTVVYRVLEIIH